jgi:broad specificity phosphatase PhoE
MRGPFDALYASPLQRAQESAGILVDRLGLTVKTEERLLETGIGGYQGQMFSALPKPYITEAPVHEGLESALSIRSRILNWTDEMQNSRSGQRLIAVSHRDVVIVALLHWMNQGLDDLPDFDLATGGVYEVRLDGDAGQIERVV